MLPQAWNLTDLFHKVFGPLGLQWPCHATWGYSSFNPMQNANNFLWRWLKLMLHASPALRCNYFEPIRYMSRYFGCFGLQSFHFPADSTWHTTQFTVHRPGGIQYVFGVMVLTLLPFLAFSLKSLNTDVISFHIFGRILGILEARAFFFVCILYLKTVSWYQ